MIIDFLSTTSLLIEQYFDQTKLGTATGFVIEKNGVIYLATNWHVITGMNPDTEKCLSSFGAQPDSLVIRHHKKNSAPNTLEWQPIKIPLYSADDYRQKKWLEHPRGKKVDVILLPIQNIPEIKINNLNLDLAQVDILPVPALPISIIGFPFGKTAGGSLPIWVTGFIASEPSVNIDNLPLFYVNAPGRTGLSGAPVILRTSGSYHNNEGKFILNGGYQSKFMGIYSGRIHNDSDICRVWKPVVFDQILSHNLTRLAAISSDQY